MERLQSTHKKVFIITVNRLIRLGLAAAVVIALAGCGGPQPTTPAATPAPSSTSQAPSSAPSSAPSAENSSSQPSESAGGDSGSKPAKSEVVAGLAKFYTTSQGLSADKAKKFATCMVDQMYDKAKPSTLTAMRDGNPAELDKADSGLLAGSAMKCQSALK